MQTCSRSAIDEVRDSEDEDGDARQYARNTEDARLVAIATKMCDGHHGQHEPDVVDVFNEASGLARQAEAALYLCNDCNVVAEVSRSEEGHDTQRGREAPQVSKRA